MVSTKFAIGFNVLNLLLIISNESKILRQRGSEISIGHVIFVLPILWGGEFRRRRVYVETPHCIRLLGYGVGPIYIDYTLSTRVSVPSS
jgi:hypothetical protein